MKNKFLVFLPYFLGFIVGYILVFYIPPVEAQSFFGLPSFYHRTVTVVTDTVTIAVTDSRVEANSATSSYTITLPVIANVPIGKEYNIKQMGTGVITIDGNASETIDGALTFVLPGQYYSVTIYKCASSAQWCVQ